MPKSPSPRDNARHKHTSGIKGMLHITRYGIEHDGHDVELQFDRRNPFMNHANLVIDGEQVDRERAFYSAKELSATAADGTEITIAIDVGFDGQLLLAQLKRDDGSWVDLEERARVG